MEMAVVPAAAPALRVGSTVEVACSFARICTSNSACLSMGAVNRLASTLQLMQINAPATGRRQHRPNYVFRYCNTGLRYRRPPGRTGIRTDEHPKDISGLPLAHDGGERAARARRLRRRSRPGRSGRRHRRLRRVPHRLGLPVRRRAYQPSAAADARPRDQRPRRRRRRRRRALARQGGHRAGRASMRPLRPLPARPRPDLPGAEDARKRHRRRLRDAHRRTGPRPVRSRRKAARAGRA